jgi:hypothetical protein
VKQSPVSSLEAHAHVGRVSRTARWAATTGAITAPVAVLGAWAAVLTHRVPGLVPQVANSDSVGPMLIAESVGRVPHSTQVTMASEGNYTAIGLDVVTRWLPGHRALWDALPLFMELVGVAVLAATVWRLVDWRAAVLCAAIAVATPPLLLSALMSQAYHNTSFLNAVVLGSLLVWLARASSLLAPWRLTVCVLVAVVTGLDLASDHLLGFIGIGPLLGVAAVSSLHRRDRRATQLLALVVGIVAVAVFVAKETSILAAHAGVRAPSIAFALASPHRVAQNASLLRDTLLAMVNGRWGFAGESAQAALLHFACGLLLLAGVLTVVWLLLRFVTGRDVRDATGDERTEWARSLFLGFWGVSAVLILAAFLFSQVPADINAIRYLPPVLYAVAVAVPVAVSRTDLRRAAGAAGVALAGLYGAYVMESTPATQFAASQDAHALIAAVEAAGIHHGYAGYWQGDLVTWASRDRVESRAVFQSAACGSADPGWFCPFPTNAVDSWYDPVPGPSFVVVEDGSTFLPNPLPTALHAQRTLRVADRFTVYLFDHDVGLDAARNAGGWPASP